MIRALFAALIVVVHGSALPASASEGKLGIELNRLQTVKAGCRVSLVVKNDLGAGLDAAQFEIVFFDTKTLVDTITAVDIGRVPARKTYVVQFDLPQRDCADFSRLLINRALGCKGGPLSEANCLDHLKISNRTKIAFGL